MKKQDILENQVKIVFLSIGSNLGNKKKNIELAKNKLNGDDLKILECSKNYETYSWPNKKNPKFINSILKIETTLSPEKLFIKCLKIENELGRVRNKKNDPRTCDIDIIDYNQMIVEEKKHLNLRIPHPRMHERSFVLIPLYELSKTWIHPIKKKSIKYLINSLNISDLTAIKLI